MNRTMKFYIQTLAIVLSLLTFPAPGAANPELLAEKSCDRCHWFASNKPGDGTNGPHLYFAGDKFQKAWLIKFLQKPEIIRKAGYIYDPGFLEKRPALDQPHPTVSEKEAKIIADYLALLKIPGLEHGAVDDVPLTRGKRARAKIKFERNYGCISCHEAINLAGKVRGGVSGPSLVNAGNRLTADWVYHWLKSPERFKPKSRMPVYKIEEADLVLIVKYLMTLKRENLKP